MTVQQIKIKDCWQTPKKIKERVWAFWGGNVHDPCPVNPDFDGLAYKWGRQTYVNPPFSEYLTWAKHGVRQSREQIWMCDHDHSTERFQILVPGSTLCLLHDRVAFVHPETGEPIKGNPRCQTLIYRGDDVKRFKEYFQDLGLIVEAVA